MIRSRKISQSRSFTLVEIMVVISVIVVVAVIGIPGLVRQRLNANEASAVASLKTITVAAVTYRAIFPSYPNNLSELHTEQAQYIDSLLASGKKQGYNFSLSGDEDAFNVTATPSKPGITGNKYFLVDVDGVIRASTTGPANISSPAI